MGYQGVEKLSFTNKPKCISNDVLEFCKQINSDSNPRFIDVRNEEFGKEGECFENVKNFIKKYGGKELIGWAIWEIPQVMLEAEFHCAVKMKDKIIDVTPRINNEKQIVFIPDPQKKYTGQSIDNLRYPIINSKVVKDFIKISEENALLQNKYCKPGDPLNNIGKNELIPMQEKILEIYTPFQLLCIKKRKNNDYCICGSYEKYRKCCMDKKICIINDILEMKRQIQPRMK